MKFSFLRVSPYDRVFRTKNHLSKLAFFPIFFSKNFGKKTVFFWFEKWRRFAPPLFGVKKWRRFASPIFSIIFLLQKTFLFSQQKTASFFCPKKPPFFYSEKKRRFFPPKKGPFFRVEKTFRFYEPQKGFVFTSHKKASFS